MLFFKQQIKGITSLHLKSYKALLPLIWFDLILFEDVSSNFKRMTGQVLCQYLTNTADLPNLNQVSQWVNQSTSQSFLPAVLGSSGDSSKGDSHWFSISERETSYVRFLYWKRLCIVGVCVCIMPAAPTLWSNLQVTESNLLHFGLMSRFPAKVCTTSPNKSNYIQNLLVKLEHEDHNENMNVDVWRQSPIWTLLCWLTCV